MVGRHIEQLKVELIGFDFRAFPDLESHLAQNAVDGAQHLGGRMQPTNGRRTTGEGNIDLVRFEGMLTGNTLQLRLGAFERLFERRARRIEACAGNRTFFRRKRTESAAQAGKCALFAEVRTFPLRKRRQIGDLFQRCEGFLFELVQLIDQ